MKLLPKVCHSSFVISHLSFVICHLLFVICYLSFLCSWATAGPLTGKVICLNIGHGWWARPTSAPTYWAWQRPVSTTTMPVEDLANYEHCRHIKNYLEDAGCIVKTSRDYGSGADNNYNSNWPIADAESKPRREMGARYYLHLDPYGEGVPATVYNTTYTYRRGQAGQTASSEENKDWRARGYYANWLLKEKGGCDLLIGMHTNALASSIRPSTATAKGTLLIWDTDSSLTDAEDYDGSPLSGHAANIANSNTLAHKVHDKMISIFRTYYDSAWGDANYISTSWGSGAGYGEARFAQMPSILIEAAYHDHISDIIAMNDIRWNRLCGQAVLKAVCDYYSITNYSLPSVITDLQSTPGTNPGEVKLRWTTPGEDGTMFAASTYLVKYSVSIIDTQTKFDNATTFVQSWTPAQRWTKETKTVNGLTEGVTYYFCMVSRNDTSDQSSISNSPSTWAQRIGGVVPNTGQIAGKVTNSSNSQQIAGATCTLTPGGEQTVTNTTGDYSFSNLTEGSYTVSVSSTGYQTNSGGGTVTAGQTTTINIQLTPSAPTTGQISGRVTSSTTGLGIIGAVCTLSPGGQTTTTYSIIGDYNFILLSPGSYTVSVSSTGYQNNSGDGTVIAGQTTMINVVLTPSAPTTGQISGRVTNNGSGLPVIGAICTLTPGSQTAIANISGDYSFSNLTAGSYTVSTSSTGFQTNTGGGTVIAGSTTTINIALIPSGATTGQISGKVTDNISGLPVSGANCTLTPGNQTATTNNNGDYVFNSLTPGQYTVLVTSIGYQNNSGGDTVVAAQVTTINIQLTPGIAVFKGNISGKVTKSNGLTAISGATVEVVSSQSLVVSSATAGTDGTYQLINVSTGTYNLRVSSSPYYTTKVVSPVIVTSNQTTTINVSLIQTGGDLYGTIMDESTGVGVVGVECKLTPGNFKTISNANGQYNFDNLPLNNNYILTLVSYGYDTSDAILNTAIRTVGERVKLDIYLRSLRALDVVTVTNKTFTPAYNSHNKLELSFNLSPENYSVGGIKGSLKIFDLRGRIIRNIDLNDTSLAQVTNYKITTWWDGTNDAGEPVNSGVYFYQLELDGQMRNGKIVLAR